MADRHSQTARRRNMAAVKSKDTKPELFIRKALHKRGLRYGLHNKSLPGKPDMVFRKYGAVLFVNGCFWHLHDCPRFSWPKTREAFWKKKITSNRDRDIRNLQDLTDLNWRVGIVWECALKGRLKRPPNDIIDLVEIWLRSEESELEIGGLSP